MNATLCPRHPARLAIFIAGVSALVWLSSCTSQWQGRVGAVLGKDNRDGRVYVREVPADESAARAGLRLDDEVLAIDGTAVRELDAAGVSRALRGPGGTTVTLLVQRGGNVLEIRVERGPIHIQAPAPSSSPSPASPHSPTPTAAGAVAP
jgi:carboxyl-terminal processing protease